METLLPAHKRFEFWCAIVIAVCFFFPWLALGPISLAGYQIGDVMRQGASSSDSGTMLITILIYLVPGTALLAAFLDFTTASVPGRASLHAIAGAMPFLAVTLACSKLDSEIVQALSIGSYLTLIAGGGSLIGAVAIMTRNQSGSYIGANERVQKEPWAVPPAMTTIAGTAAILSGVWSSADLLEFSLKMMRDSISLSNSNSFTIGLGVVKALLAIIGGIALIRRTPMGVILCAVFSAIFFFNFALHLDSWMFGVSSTYLRFPFTNPVFLGRIPCILIHILPAGTTGALVSLIWYRYGLPKYTRHMVEQAATTAELSIESRLEQLKSLQEKGLISSEEYESRKDQLLSSLVSIS